MIDIKEIRNSLERLQINMEYFVENTIQQTIKVRTTICQNNTPTFIEKSYLI